MGFLKIVHNLSLVLSISDDVQLAGFEDVAAEKLIKALRQAKRIMTGKDFIAIATYPFLSYAYKWYKHAGQVWQICNNRW